MSRDAAQSAEAPDDWDVALLAACFDASPDWESWSDAAGRPRYVSPAALTHSGVAPAEFLADPRRLWSLLPPEELAACQDHLAACAGPGCDRLPPARLQYRVVAPSGDVRWLEHVCHAVPGGRRCTHRDVSAARAETDRFRLLADSADDYVALNDTHGHRLYLSPSYTRVTGWTVEDLRHGNWRDRMHPDDLPAVERAHAANLAGEATVVEHRVRCRDGSWIWVEMRCKPVLDANGEVELMVVWSHDITARRAAEQALRHSERVHRRVIEGSGGVAFVRNFVENRYEFVSEGIERLTGYTAAEFSTRSWDNGFDQQVPTGEYAGLSYAEAIALLRTERRRVWTCDYRYRHRDGSSRWVACTSTDERDESGQLVRSVGLLLDITERKAAEAERERLLGELRQALAEVKTLAGLLPMCAWCREVRDDAGYWQQVEQFVVAHTDVAFSHGICPQCMRRLFPEDALAAVWLTTADLLDSEGLLARLKVPGEPVGQFVREQLNERTRRELDDHDPTWPARTALLDAIVRELNRVLERGELYDPSRLAALRTDSFLATLLASGAELSLEQRLMRDRLLLEAAWPGLLRPCGAGEPR